MDRRTKERIYGWKDGRTVERTEGRMDGRMNGWEDEEKEGWMVTRRQMSGNIER